MPTGKERATGMLKRLGCPVGEKARPLLPLSDMSLSSLLGNTLILLVCGRKQT